MVRRAPHIFAVIPAQAGIQQDKNSFCLNPLDSRLRGNDEVGMRLFDKRTIVL